jgi:hypothetical protein
MLDLTPASQLPPDSPEEALRARLFEKARAYNNRLVERTNHVAGHLASREALGVIGSLDGAEKDIESLRMLMSLIREVS